MPDLCDSPPSGQAATREGQRAGACTHTGPQLMLALTVCEWTNESLAEKLSDSPAGGQAADAAAPSVMILLSAIIRSTAPL